MIFITWLNRCKFHPSAINNQGSWLTLFFLYGQGNLVCYRYVKEIFISSRSYACTRMRHIEIYLDSVRNRYIVIYYNDVWNGKEYFETRIRAKQNHRNSKNSTWYTMVVYIWTYMIQEEWKQNILFAALHKRDREIPR